MKTMMGLMMGLVLAAEMVWGAPPVAQTPAQVAAKAEAVKILANADNDKAAEALVATIKRMISDKTGQAVKDGMPELTVAALVKIDLKRALIILPRMFNSIIGVVRLDMFQRLVASAVLASGSSSAVVVQAILTGLGNQERWVSAVKTVAQDIAAPLPGALQQAILTISPTILPPAVIPPGTYEGQ